MSTQFACLNSCSCAVLRWEATPAALTSQAHEAFCCCFSLGGNRCFFSAFYVTGVSPDLEGASEPRKDTIM